MDGRQPFKLFKEGPIPSEFTMTEIELNFLRESNNIENVWDDVSLQQAILAWEYLKNKRKITIPVILKTHKILMKYQPIDEKYKGKFRQCAIYIGGREGKPWEFIPSIMSQWCIAINTSEEFQQTHVQYEWIHPFIDGNGRTGRIFMNWQRLKLGLPISVIEEQKKWDYYEWF